MNKTLLVLQVPSAEAKFDITLELQSHLISHFLMHLEANTSSRKFNSFPHDKNLDQTKLKAFADDKLNVTTRGT